MRRGWMYALSVALLTGACGGSGDRVVVAAGTTVVDSGLIDHVVAAYEKSHPAARISVVAQPTALALELGRGGSADVTITHAPIQELEFADGGGALHTASVFTSRFLLVGPSSLEGAFKGYELPEVLREVVASGIAFVSRADGSGTYDKEWENWIEAGLDPRVEDWYLETGQGMGPTLLVADQREALVLVELGAWMAGRDTVTLIDMRLDPGALDNPYTAMVMASSAQADEARAFVDWLTSLEGRAAIEAANRELFGTIVYAAPGEG